MRFLKKGLVSKPPKYTYTEHDYGMWLPEGAGNVSYAVCECGVSITMGKEADDPHFHSDWCPVYKEWAERGYRETKKKK